MQRQYTIQINAESRDFSAQFSADQSFLLHFKIVTFYSNDKDGSICLFRREKGSYQPRLLKKSLKRSRLRLFIFRAEISFYKISNLKLSDNPLKKLKKKEKADG